MNTYKGLNLRCDEGDIWQHNQDTKTRSFSCRRPTSSHEMTARRGQQAVSIGDLLEAMEVVA